MTPRCRPGSIEYAAVAGVYARLWNAWSEVRNIAFEHPPRSWKVRLNCSNSDDILKSGRDRYCRSLARAHSSVLPIALKRPTVPLPERDDGPSSGIGDLRAAAGSARVAAGPRQAFCLNHAAMARCRCQPHGSVIDRIDHKLPDIRWSSRVPACTKGARKRRLPEREQSLSLCVLNVNHCWMRVSRVRQTIPRSVSRRGCSRVDSMKSPLPRRELLALAIGLAFWALPAFARDAKARVLCRDTLPRRTLALVPGAGTSRTAYTELCSIARVRGSNRAFSPAVDIRGTVTHRPPRRVGLRCYRFAPRLLVGQCGRDDVRQRDRFGFWGRIINSGRALETRGPFCTPCCTL